MAKSKRVRGTVVSPVSGARATVTSRAVEETIEALQHAVREQGHALAKAEEQRAADAARIEQLRSGIEQLSRDFAHAVGRVAAAEGRERRLRLALDAMRNAPWWGRLFRIANAIPDEQAAA